MAEVVDELPLSGIENRKYPWDEWLDGRIWKLTKGTDFLVATKDMRNMCGGNARSRGVKVATRIRGDDLYLQATPRTGQR